jgi:hypothetical protein
MGLVSSEPLRAKERINEIDEKAERHEPGEYVVEDHG